MKGGTRFCLSLLHPAVLFHFQVFSSTVGFPSSIISQQTLCVCARERSGLLFRVGIVLNLLNLPQILYTMSLSAGRRHRLFSYRNFIHSVM